MSCLVMALVSCAVGPSPSRDAPKNAAPAPSSAPPSTPSPGPIRAPILEPHQIPSPGFAAHGTTGVLIRDDCEAWISGTLVDESGFPIEGVRVQAAYSGLKERDHALGALYGATESITDASGSFALMAPPTLHFRADLCASKRGFVDFALESVPLVAGATLNLGVRSMMRGERREFEVVYADGSPAEGVGVARMRVRMSQAVEQQPVWLGATDHRGRLKTDVIPAEERVAWFSTFASAIVPGQCFIDFPGQGSGDSPPLLRLVLPKRRWIEGRLEGLRPGVQYGVRSLPFWKSFWGLANFPDDHPVRKPWADVIPTDGPVRVPTLIDGGDALPLLGAYARQGDD